MSLRFVIMFGGSHTRQGPNPKGFMVVGDELYVCILCSGNPRHHRELVSSLNETWRAPPAPPLLPPRGR